MSFLHAEYKKRSFFDVLNELALMRVRKNNDPEQTSVYQDEKKGNARVSKNLRKDKNMKTKRQVLLPLPHYIQCPITKCKHSMDPRFVMAHYVTEHKDLKIHRVFDDFKENFPVQFKPLNLEKYATECFAILSFGGKVGAKEESLPIVGYRELPNEGLPPDLEHLKYDLPILILASRSIISLPPDPSKGNKQYGQNLVVVWPASIELDTSAKDLYCWILGKSPAFTESRSSLVALRSFAESRDSMDLLLLDHSTFHLNMMDIDRILIFGEILKIEIKLKLFESIGQDDKTP